MIEAVFINIHGVGKHPVTMKHPRVPENCRVYAIGDIHGRADLLQKTHDIILDDAAGVNSNMELSVIYLGDYVDRGMHSREVIDLLINNPLPGLKAVHIRGNHDQKMLIFLDNPQRGASWLSVGGGATVYSYGIRVPRNVPATKRLTHIRDELRERLPDSHINFLKGLKSSFSVGDYFFTHAGIDPDRALDNQKTEDLVWGNEKFLGSDAAFEKIVVHGHIVGDAPVVCDNRICIDTGAFLSNTLTCLVLENETRRFLSTGGSPV